MASNLLSGSESLGELRLKLSLVNNLYQPTLKHKKHHKNITTHKGYATNRASPGGSRIRSMVSSLLRVLRTCMPKGSPPLFSAARVPHLHVTNTPSSLRFGRHTSRFAPTNSLCTTANICLLRSPRKSILRHSQVSLSRLGLNS